MTFILAKGVIRGNRSPPYPPRRLCVKIYRMGFRIASHAVYDGGYHLVWCPKYRKKVFGKEYLRKRAKELFSEIAEEYDLIIEELEVAADHVHILVSFPSGLSDPECNHTLAQAAREKALRVFDIELVAKQYLELYKKIT